MDRYEALERIKAAWNNTGLSLGDKITCISNDFYAVGLDLATTAAFIRATPAELDALLSLSVLDDEMIEMISKADPPKTTWALLASASNEEIRQALNALESASGKYDRKEGSSSVSKFIYQQMLDVAGPTSEQLVGMLTGGELGHALKKGQDFNALTDWDNKFFKSVVVQKKRGKALSDKQLKIIVRILTDLADRGVIKRDSIDGDKEICDKILDAIGK
jgi:hypothetical protein